jgi:DNA-binding response OmpR family regulator
MKKILIIEDDHVVANVYRNKLALDGFLVETAYDGQAGYELMTSFRPDAVLMDLMLPKLPGVELIKKIRLEPDFKETPLIIFSSTYLTNMVQDAWKAGATKCLSKASCTPKHVIGVLCAALGSDGVEGMAGTAFARKDGCAPPVAAVADKPASDASDAEFQNELRNSFVESLPATLVTLRAFLQSVVKAENETARHRQVGELYRRIRALTGNAALAGMLPVAEMADPLEVLLKELHDKPKNINVSTLRTLASAIDLLGVLFEPGTLSDKEVPPGTVLVVDDDVISRRAVTYALEKARLRSVSIEDPAHAFKLLSERGFDLVILDVAMPAMSGFELCSKLRTLPAHKKTPVLFVTNLTDFESRANSSVSGGNDFIAKPFLFIELAVKALVYVMRGRLETAKQ